MSFAKKGKNNMLIAIASDSHDHDKQIEKLHDELRNHKVKELIHLGDMIAPTSFRQLIQGFDGDIHAILGNNDGDIEKLYKTASEYDNVQLYGIFGETTIDGIHLAFTHKPTTSHALARSGMYDVVLHGHTHIQHTEIIENCMIVNPGAIRPPLEKDHHASFAIIDTEKPKEVEFIEL
jgi:uncharacterized protein